jgi:hypothetical protein
MPECSGERINGVGPSVIAARICAASVAATEAWARSRSISVRCARDVATLVSAEYDAFPEVVLEARVALYEEPIDDAAVVRDDVAEVDAERCVRAVRFFREQFEVQLLLEVRRESVEILMRQLDHGLLSEGGYQIAGQVMLDAEPVRGLFV